MKQEKLLKRQGIQEERGVYTRLREKKFRYLKNIGQMDNYYKQKAGIPKDEDFPIKTTFKKESGIRILFLKIFKWFKQLWRSIYVIFAKKN